MRTLLAKFREPVVADRSIDLMAAGFWLCFAGWGVASTIAGLPTISISTTSTYELFWGASIASLSLIALMATSSTFCNSKNVATRIRKKLIELVSVSMLAGFVAVYPILLFTMVWHGDLDRVASVFSASSFLIFPTWRVRHLYFRIRKLREISLTEPS